MNISSISSSIYILLLCISLLKNISSCSPGEYAVGNMNPVCKPCRVGHYCARDGSGVLDEPCSRGTFNPNIGASSASACLKCPVGSYGPQIGMEKCTVCPVGDYCSETGALNYQSCPAGTYQPKQGAISSTYCLACPVGTYTPGRSYATCLPCESGFYSDVTGSLYCKSCPPGTYNTKEGSTSSQDCRKCPSGTINLFSGSHKCYPCPDGCSCPDPAQKPIPLSNSSKCMDESTTIIPSNVNTSTQSLTLPSFTLLPISSARIPSTIVSTTTKKIISTSPLIPSTIIPSTTKKIISTSPVISSTKIKTTTSTKIISKLNSSALLS